MTQPRIAAASRKCRLIRSAAFSTFTLSALAGGVVLSVEQAHAACTPGASSKTFNDLGTTITDTLTIITCNGGLDTASLNLTSPGNPNLYPLYQTTLDLNHATGALITGTGFYNIDKFSTPKLAWFDKVALSWVTSPSYPNDTVSKEVCAGSYIGGVCTGSILGTITTNGGVLSLPNTYTSIGIKDTVIGTGVLHINNDFRQTPGPLPVLGAGAAFGFSRKLRTRIKAVRTA
jgi:hypothetical protein